VVLVSSALTATAVALSTTALVFDAVNWPIYAAANVLIALTYGLIGALIAPIFGRVGGRVRRVPAAVPGYRHRAEPHAPR